MSERKSFKIPGYDCRDGRCQHTPKGDHGICGEEWVYVVKGGDRAVSTSLHTRIYPATVPARPLDDPPYYGGIGFHRGWQPYEECTSRPCDWVDGGKCYSDVGFGIGDDLWKRTGDAARFEQSEEFWKLLESYLPDDRPPPDQDDPEEILP